MTDRILLTNDRLIISKPTKDASDPNLVDNDKVFDSDWQFGGAIIETGYKEVLRQVGGSVGYTIDFKKPLSYVPLVQCYSVHPPWAVDFSGNVENWFRQGPPVFYEYSPDGDPNGRVRDYITVTNSQIWIPPRRNTNDYLQRQGPIFYNKSGGSNQPVYHCFFYIVFAL